MSNGGYGPLPSLNDTVGGVIIVFAYLNRLYALAQPDAHYPWYGEVMTDLLLPSVAASWIFVMAMYSAYVKLGEP